MPNDKDTALALQKKYYGDPQGLAQHLVNICLNQRGVVQEVFLILDDFSTLDVGFRFLNLLPSASLLKLANTKSGKAFCEILLGRLLNTPNNTSEPVSPGIDLVIELRRLKDAIDHSSPTDDGENPYYTIDEGIILSDEAITVLNKVGAEYLKLTSKKFNVNSGTRDAHRQAEAMYIKTTLNDSFSEYTNKIALNEILATYRNAKSAGKSQQDIIATMTDTIQKQINRNVFISNHLRAGALDVAIRAKNGSPALEEQAFRKAVKTVTGKEPFYEGKPRHFHFDY